MVVNREESGRKGLRKEVREGLKKGKPNWKVKERENLKVR